jgi:hypothetical protein
MGFTEYLPLGKPGSVLNTGTGRLFTQYPTLANTFKQIHELRGESKYSHPYVFNTGKPTRRIEYQEAQRAASGLHSALLEAAMKW